MRFRKRKFELVHDWKYCCKWLSMQMSLLGGFGMGVWALLPQLKEYIPPEWMAVTAMGLFILICFSRLVNQGSNERNRK